MESVKLSVDAIHALARRCLLANGCNDENATALADTITAAERDGSASHGLFRLPGYVASLRSGKVDGNASPRVEQLAPAVVRVDGAEVTPPLRCKPAGPRWSSVRGRRGSRRSP